MSFVNAVTSDARKMAIEAGKIGQTLCPLRPYGRIEIEGEAYEAKAENGWIDERVDVVVVKLMNFGIVVREQEVSTESSSKHQVPKRRTATTDNRQRTATSIPLHGPEFWLERVNAILVGSISWTAIGSILLLTGLPVGLAALLLPVGGAISGAVFQYFIRGARNLEGAYSDHRPAAYLFAAWMLIGAVLGVTATFSIGAGIGIITSGLILGTLFGGLFGLASRVF